VNLFDQIRFVRKISIRLREDVPEYRILVAAHSSRAMTCYNLLMITVKDLCPKCGGLLAPICLILLAVAGCASKASHEPLLLGHLSPANGPDKALDQRALQAIEIAVEETNKQDGLLGGRHVALLHPEFDPADLEKFKYTAVRLITVDRVAGIVGGTNAAEANRLGRVAKDHDVPVLTPTELTAEFSDETLFSVNANVRFKGQCLAHYAAQELKATHVSLWVDKGTATSPAFCDAFQKEFLSQKDGGVERSMSEAYRDFPNFSGAAKKSRQGVVLFIGQSQGAISFREKLKTAGLEIPLIFAGDEERFAERSRETDAGDIFWAAPYTSTESAPLNSEFAKKFKQRFHDDPDLNAALANDAVNILLEAMRRADSVQGAKVVKALASDESKPFDCLTGKLTFDKDHTAQRTVFVLQGSKVLKQYEPERN
jgi:branched-chain amino acid transport system substrate-binding protein